MKQHGYWHSELWWVFIGQVLAFSGSFVGIKVLTNLLGPAGFGQLALGLSIAGLLQMCVYGPIEQIVLRFVSICSERKQLAVLFFLIRDIHRLIGLVLVGLAIGATILTGIVSGYVWAQLVGLAVLLSIATGVNATFSSVQNALRQRKVVALHQGMEAWIKIVLSVVCLYGLSKSAPVALMGFVCGTVLVIVSQRRFALGNSMIHANWTRRNIDRSSYEHLRQDVLSYGTPFLLFALFGIVSTYADRWIIFGLSGADAVGGYAAIYQIANAPVALLAGVTNQLMAPLIFERAGAFDAVSKVNESSRLLYQTLWLCSIALVCITSTAYVFGEQIVTLVTTPEFAPYHDFLWILTLGLALSNVGQLLVMRGLSSKQTGIYILPKLIQTVTFIVMSVILLTTWGLPGVAWALCLASGAYLTAVSFANRRIRFAN